MASRDRFGSKADICSAKCHVRFALNSDYGSGTRVNAAAPTCAPPKATYRASRAARGVSPAGSRQDENALRYVLRYRKECVAD